ncbi:uncharacterized protein TM35_000014210 [Trypanosoma theileri]|uniref:Uncharacterized protein n=1 Tax=Trypanosoma theileri TaxID=67003 RepID=A0A1X0P9E1_9TRYP|nr:uncharacterized protein TM35_000014210 [Trypanosoma theileri]ORC93544.1 hypothetical protein TM35_000014210 [Trypanosoma theileri]
MYMLYLCGRVNSILQASLRMNAREELLQLLSAADAEIQRHHVTSSTAMDSELLSAVADYIEVGVNEEATLKRLQSALLNQMMPQSMIRKSTEDGMHPVKSENNDDIAKQESSSAITPEEMGRQRAQRIFLQALAVRNR